jgi:hypothetical protein
MSRTINEQEPPSDSGGDAAPETQVGKFYKANRQFRSRTDPDATLVRQGGLKSRPRYKTHRVVDDAHEIITAVETTTGAVDEGQRLPRSFSLLDGGSVPDARVSNSDSTMLVFNAMYGSRFLSRTLRVLPQRGHTKRSMRKRRWLSQFSKRT